MKNKIQRLLKAIESCADRNGLKSFSAHYSLFEDSSELIIIRNRFTRKHIDMFEVTKELLVDPKSSARMLVAEIERL